VNRNLLVAVFLSFGILLSWDMLVMRPKQAALRAQAKAAPTASLPTASLPTTVSPAAPSGSASPAPVAAPAAGPAAATVQSERLVEYELGRHVVSLNLTGGAIRRWRVQEDSPAGGWIDLLPQDHPSRALELFPDLVYTVKRGGDALILTARRPDGLLVEETLRIAPQGYLHEIGLRLTNPGKTPLAAAASWGWGPGIASGDLDKKEQVASQRALAYLPPRKVSKFKEGAHDGAFAWWGVDARYFLAAFLNEGGQIVHMSVSNHDKYYEAKESSSYEVAPGASLQETRRLYVGPKGYARLASLGLGLEHAVDFGFFGGVGKVVLRILYLFHGLTRNYGWAIILLTLLIQVIALPLTLKSFKHSLRMKELQPQLKRLQELYKGDPKRLNVEMLNLYQKNGLKFMGMEGCFPVLIQLPVFYALYTTLRNAFELRGAPWMFWVHDLSIHDPYYVLPVLMGIGMLAQQKMTMAAMDPAQARMMYMMPVLFTFFFLKLPSGLVMYWFTNSLATLAVQAILIKRQAKGGGTP
jgi:YidC/Oxa1 family membrane protein insertase